MLIDGDEFVTWLRWWATEFSIEKGEGRPIIHLTLEVPELISYPEKPIIK